MDMTLIKECIKEMKKTKRDGNVEMEVE